MERYVKVRAAFGLWCRASVVLALATAVACSSGGGSDNAPPTASFPAFDYTVQGAGTAAVNGNYTENGTHSTPARPKYDRESGGYYLYAFEASDDGFQHFVIHDALLVDSVDSVFTALYFRGYNGATTPQEDTWITGTGTGPAPTLVRTAISGDTSGAGNILTGHYIYSDPDGDAEGATTFQWYRGGTAIVGATSIDYTIDPVDVGSSLRIQVTPVDAGGLAGTPVLSKAVPIP